MAELEMVRIRHPKIDDGERVIEVPAQSVPVHQQSGWELVPEDSAAEEPGDSGEAADRGQSSDEESPSQDQQPRRRRGQKEE